MLSRILIHCSRGYRPFLLPAQTISIPPRSTQYPLQRVQSQNFHVTRPQNVHPLILLLFKPVSKLAAILSGRQFRKWYKRLSDEEKFKFQQQARQNRHIFTGAGLGLLGFMAYLYWIHIETCPITKRRRFVALKENQLERIGKTEFEQLMQEFKDHLVPQHYPIYGRVARVANKILRSNADFDQIKDKNWTITVIEDPQRNAFVLPSGNIFVFTGMLDACANEHQLGIVLSHEISHCLLGHMAEKISHVNFVNLIVLLPLALLWAVIPTDGIALITDWFFSKVIDILIELPFSRDQETEADEVGLMLASKACLDIREAPVFWGNMALMEETEAALPELISTHPTHENRQQHLLDLLPKAMSVRNECGCARLQGPDPNLAFNNYADEQRKKFAKVLRIE